MAAIVAEAMGAGASGFSTNRFQIHKSRTGRIVPGTFAPHEELRAIAAKVGEAGHGIIQAISEGTIYPNPEVDEMPELDLFGSISIGHRPAADLHDAQSNPGADIFRRVLDGAAEWNARGAQLRPQIIPRAVTIMTTLGGYHGFIFRPSYKKIADLPVAERAAEMRRPEVRERILSEADEPTDTGEFLLAMVVMNNLDLVFPLAAPIDYEPDPSKSIAGQAKALGQGSGGSLLRSAHCRRWWRFLRGPHIELPRRNTRAVSGDAAGSQYRQRSIRCRCTRDDDL